eukprot:896509-Rhodomonas_salina.1
MGSPSRSRLHPTIRHLSTGHAVAAGARSDTTLPPGTRKRTPSVPPSLSLRVGPHPTAKYKAFCHRLYWKECLLSLISPGASSAAPPPTGARAPLPPPRPPEPGSSIPGLSTGQRILNA